MTRPVRWGWLAGVAALTGAIIMLASHAEARNLRVFGPASFANVLPRIGMAFAATTAGQRRPIGPRDITYSFAATSTLARQLTSGAGADVFISADARWMTYLADRHAVKSESVRTVASNLLVVVVPLDRPFTIDTKKFSAWRSLVGGGRLALGDPEHVPAGIYAEAALRHLNIWPFVKRRIAAADNVRSAMALVERGEAVAGIVYATDALVSSNVHVAGIIPAEAHLPIIYPAALANSGGHPLAQAFLDYLTSPEAQAILKQNGFGPARKPMQRMRRGAWPRAPSQQ